VIGTSVGLRAADGAVQEALLLHSAAMQTTAATRQLSMPDMEAILRVTRGLAAPFDLMTMLGEVVAAAKQVLRAERGSVWLYDAAANELVLEVATGIKPVRVPSGSGLAGACARERAIINVPDCYADPRFDPSVDKASGYRTRCMLTLPLVDHRDELVGVMQVLNKHDGVFDAYDEVLATALAAQCAVALQRVRMTDALIEGEKMRKALEMAREVQMSTLPSAMPSITSYDLAAMFEPAELTGGDTYDLASIGDRLLIVLGDATGHGIAPALSVTQMQAMLRMAFRLGADIDTAFMQVNNRLAETLADDRFITAFIGVLDPATHALRFQSGGQGPISILRAATSTWDRYRPTSFPLGAMPLATLRPALATRLMPGDMLVVVSDGVYEYENVNGEQFGEKRVQQVLADGLRVPMNALVHNLRSAVERFASGAPQEDDMTAVLLRRSDESTARGLFPRSFESLSQLVRFTDEAFERHRIDPGLKPPVELAVEELFTNMVKYGSGSTADVHVALTREPQGVELTLIDRDVEAFDVTQTPDVDVGAPIEQRRPGGLGVHLIRKMAQDVNYEYAQECRQSRITVRFGIPQGVK
jgi:phosphoserine phosphatase